MQTLTDIGLTIRQPERLAQRWRDRGAEPSQAPDRTIFLLLLATAVFGLAAYGVTMGMHRGAEGMLSAAFKAPLAAGFAWTVALPSFFIINSATGSKLDLSTTALAALVTCSFGALAMLAGVPVNWFFTLVLPYTAVRWAINLTIFAGVGISMNDVFLRIMRALEPDRGRGPALLWLGLVGTIGAEMMMLLKLFQF